MKRYTLSAAARLDLLQIWDYLAEHSNIDTADRIIAELKDAMRKLAQMPGMGNIRSDLAAETLRFWAFIRI